MLNELGNTLAVLLAAGDGTLEALQCVSTLPPAFNGDATLHT